jgi:hypothetical protein
MRANNYDNTNEEKPYNSITIDIYDLTNRAVMRV